LKKWNRLPQLSNPISHFLFILNDLKRYESVNLNSTIPLWTPKAIKLCPKIFISKHLPCKTEHLMLWTKHYFETQYIFLNFEWSSWWWVHQVQYHIPLWTRKTTELCSRMLSSLKTSVWTLICILNVIEFKLGNCSMFNDV